MNIYQNKKEQLIKVFEDTQSYFSKFKDSINYSINHSKIYRELDIPEIKPRYSEPVKISVNKYRTIESAQYYKRKNPELKIGILNFASASNPGGGVLKGSSAQEECICRVSTLYPILAESRENRKEFYDYHRSLKSNIYSDRIIYSPRILVFKSDNFIPSYLPERNQFEIEVITCAAPNLNRKPNQEMNPEIVKFNRVSESQLYKIQESRTKKILSVANENEIDILILGAFGCGAFKNNPYSVAEAFRVNIYELFKYSFKEISFSIFYSNESSKENYTAFKEIFS